MVTPSRSRSPSSGSDTAAKRRKVEQPTEVAAFLFRRDLRVCDNTALLALAKRAAAASLPVLPLFFFNPVQCSPSTNHYFGRACFQFMCESLAELDQGELGGRLVCLRGSDAACLQVVQEAGLRVRMVGYNEDFSPFALVRDAELARYCAAHRVERVSRADDYTLLPPAAVLNKTHQPYSVFTSFCRCVLQEHVSQIRRPDRAVLPAAETFYADGKAVFAKRRVDPLSLFTPMPHLCDRGGRAAALACLSRVAGMAGYAEDRNDIPGDRTSHLSPHMKFGTVSTREVFAAAVAALGASSPFVVQLVWREFYAMLLYHHPRLAQAQLDAFPPEVVAAYAARGEARGAGPRANDPFLAKYHTYTWRWSEAHFEAFRQGRTGVPLVDAAVRCVSATGWCHNRCRMVLASFLVKVLGVDWREGERWFATVAVDYDVANNSGGWLWSSGQGADAQPYFRTFNPFRQSERFDPDSVFVHRWVEELRGVPPSVIHKWDVYCARHGRTYAPPDGDPDRPTRGDHGL
ncbi:deoxyribodipyrimidine photolyase [Strigomonas culicis]|uniref:Deoxyribodipyrimidine photolyase n=1 Tax=Strigomonas culicis TaxID=28005 RepID=S9V5P0_9TRYP|nr:deoxyribodipyrimidine photolyase [Strigomonas culicis]|eukprot:EPY22251.1 deoxyribodipyrimidine photolyase [Strigomonas culicis]